MGAACISFAAHSRAVPFYAASFEPAPSIEALTALGAALFREPSLSASGRTACSTCHDPAHAFGPPNALAVQRAGMSGRSAGLRAVPSLEYRQSVPDFTEHFTDDEGDDGIDQGPAGGFTWDGRARSIHEQAALPLFSPLEMANGDAHAVLGRLRRGRLAGSFRATFGAAVFEDEPLAFKGLLMALETYQQDAATFYPYTSKYDASLRGEANLTAAEARGLAAFEDPARGNCARCHPSGARGGALPSFSDFGYAAIGVPRNPAIPANARSTFYDLGLCGPLRTDYAGRGEYCGLFRTPSLRNVATRSVFFHNGAVRDLTDAVSFYAQRDVRPQRWYPRAPAGAVKAYDDMPPEYRANLDRQAPFGQRPGEAPALSEADVEDIVAFLRTLTDGYRAGSTTGPTRRPGS